MTDFGSGIYLTSSDSKSTYDRDLDVDRSGDLRTTNTEIEELEKDIAFLTAVRLEGQIGAPLRPEVLNRIDGLVRGGINGEDRIDRILSLDVSESRADPNSVVIRALITTDNTQQELVFSEGIN